MNGNKKRRQMNGNVILFDPDRSHYLPDDLYVISAERIQQLDEESKRFFSEDVSEEAEEM